MSRLADVFREADRVGLRGVVLLGEPGSGKTTGARQIAWRLASGESRPEDFGLPPGITPVLLHYHKLRPAALARKNGSRFCATRQPANSPDRGSMIPATPC